MPTYRLPVKLASLANLREHWSKRAERARIQKMATLVVEPHPLPCIVTITRMGPKPLDTDNLAISAKHLRDGIAARLGVDDADPRVEWRYRQDKSPEHEAVVTIQPKRDVEIIEPDEAGSLV